MRNITSNSAFYADASITRRASSRLRLWAVAMCLPFISPAMAHESKAGNIAIVHAFATPTLAGTSTGAAYITNLENTGEVPDRLLRASSPVAGRVELHTMTMDAQGVMRMREADGIVLAPHVPVRMKPGMGVHLMLVDMKRPLKEGESFPMTMEFEHSGKAEVKVVVQAYKPSADAMASMPGMGGMADHKH